jgi:thiol-disulfide isomerase/thioredoxin
MLVAAASAVAGYFAYGWWHQPPSQDTVEGGQLPNFMLTDMTGKQRSANEWAGKVMVVNFWATWCTPCRKEIPTFIKMQKELAGKGLQVVGIAIDNLPDVKAYAASIGINYPVLLGDQDAIELSQRLGNRMDVLPFTAVIDRQGRISYTKLGELTPELAEHAILPLL